MDIKKTITTIFFVPLLKIPDYLKTLREHDFLNGYIRDDIKGMEYGEDSIFLLFRPKDLDRFREFLDAEYERAKAVMDDYDHPNGFVVVVYRLDDKYHRDYQLIKRGKYSLTSPAFQEEFSKTITIEKEGKNKESISLQYRIFNKTEDLKKFWEDRFDVELEPSQELWEMFEEGNEILTEDKLIEYGKNI